MKQKTRLLVCGGRMFGRVADIVKVEDLDAAIKNAEIERAYLKATLDKLKETLELECLIEGQAKGADQLAGKWADENDVTHLKFPADWKRYGRSAGWKRNQRMLDEGQPSIVVAFPGGVGTKDMVQRAKKAGVPVYEVIYETVE